MKRSLGLIIKATRLCNLRCIYCTDWRAEERQIMEFEVLANLTARALRDPSHGSVDFIWHGGEPTILGIPFFERALWLQARFRSPGQVVTNSLQTNATRLDDAWARFLKANRFSVSISIDGPEDIHDRQRPFAGGRGSFAAVRRGLDTLTRHGITPAVLMVVDKESLTAGADALFDLCLDLELRSFGLLAAKPRNQPDAVPGTPADHYVTPREMGRFLTRLFDRWIAHGDSGIRIREFSGLLRRLDGREAESCVLAGHCLGQYFIIEPNGDVAHCDLFQGDDDYCLGSILTDDFSSLRRNPRLKMLREARAAALSAMTACPHFNMCNGWCPHEHYTAARHDPDFMAGCCGLSDLITYLQGRLPVREVAAPHLPAGLSP